VGKTISPAGVASGAVPEGSVIKGRIVLDNAVIGRQ
jgi:hypothetical protein